MRGSGLSILVLILLLVGCETFTFQQYSLSQRNIDTIRETMALGGVSTLAVGEFTATRPSQSEIGCGLNGEISTPQEVTFVKYIREAIIDELKKARVYSLDQIEAGRVITGNLNSVKLNTGSGSWDINITITFKTGKSFTVAESYQFDDVSCEQSAAAFNPAVQELIYKIFTNPTFRENFGVSGN